VCERLVKPLTLGVGASLARCLEVAGATTTDGTRAPLVGWPDLFVSHARSYRFSLLYEALGGILRKDDTPGGERHEEMGRAYNHATFVWLDIFSQHQHMALHRIVRWPSVFLHTIRLIGCAVVVMSPWSSPLPARRAWLLWEMLCAIQGHAQLIFFMPPSERRSILATMSSGATGSISSTLAAVNSRAATCFTQADQLMIHQMIGDLFEHGSGHDYIDVQVTERLRD